MFRRKNLMDNIVIETPETPKKKDRRPSGLRPSIKKPTLGGHNFNRQSFNLSLKLSTSVSKNIKTLQRDAKEKTLTVKVKVPEESFNSDPFPGTISPKNQKRKSNSPSQTPALGDTSAAIIIKKKSQGNKPTKAPIEKKRTIPNQNYNKTNTGNAPPRTKLLVASTGILKPENYDKRIAREQKIKTKNGMFSWKTKRDEDSFDEDFFDFTLTKKESRSKSGKNILTSAKETLKVMFKSSRPNSRGSDEDKDTNKIPVRRTIRRNTLE